MPTDLAWMPWGRPESPWRLRRQQWPARLGGLRTRALPLGAGVCGERRGRVEGEARVLLGSSHRCFCRCDCRLCKRLASWRGGDMAGMVNRLGCRVGCSQAVVACVARVSARRRKTLKVVAPAGSSCAVIIQARPLHASLMPTTTLSRGRSDNLCNHLCRRRHRLLRTRNTMMTTHCLVRTTGVAARRRRRKARVAPWVSHKPRVPSTSIHLHIPVFFPFPLLLSVDVCSLLLAVCAVEG